MNIAAIQNLLEAQYPLARVENLEFVSASRSTLQNGVDTSCFKFDLCYMGVRLEKEIWLTEQNRTNKTLQELMN